MHEKMEKKNKENRKRNTEKERKIFARTKEKNEQKLKIKGENELL